MAQITSNTLAKNVQIGDTFTSTSKYGTTHYEIVGIGSTKTQLTFDVNITISNNTGESRSSVHNKHCKRKAHLTYLDGK